MNNKTNKKSLPSLRRIKNKIGAIGILVIVCTLLSAVTMAYVFTQTDTVENTFVPSKVSSDVVETFVDNVKSNVMIENTGDTEAYIRATIVATWVTEVTDSSGNKSMLVHPNKPVEGTDYVIERDNDKWQLGDDGFWYYKDPVAPGVLTATLIKECELADAARVPEGYSLSVEIVASAIQSTPTSVVLEEWKSGGFTIEEGETTLSFEAEE